MGINGFFKFLKDKKGLLPSTISLKDFRNERIAIDFSIWMYSIHSNALSIIMNGMGIDVIFTDIDHDKVYKEFLIGSLKFIEEWKSHGVTPIFVFDGTAPIEKKDTREKRKIDRAKNDLKLANKKAELNGLADNFKDVLDISHADLEEFKQLSKNSIKMRYEDIGKFRKFLTDLGIPNLQAKTEAEKLCSMLCIEGVAKTTLSTDSDNFIFGCPLLLTGFHKKERDQNGSLVPIYLCYTLESILEKMEMTHVELIILAITSGCDYNKNIPNLGIGRAWPLVKQHGSVENFPKKYDTTCLNYEVCRRLFMYETSESLIDDGFVDFNIGTYLKQGKETLFEAGLEEYMEKMPEFTNNVPWFGFNTRYDRSSDKIYYTKREKPTGIDYLDSDEEEDLTNFVSPEKEEEEDETL